MLSSGTASSVVRSQYANRLAALPLARLLTVDGQPVRASLISDHHHTLPVSQSTQETLLVKVRSFPLHRCKLEL